MRGWRLIRERLTELVRAAVLSTCEVLGARAEDSRRSRGFLSGPTGADASDHGARVDPAVLAHRVQGTLVGSAEGQRPLLAGGQLVGRRQKEYMSNSRGHGAACRPSPTRGDCIGAVYFEGILNAGTTKRSSVTCHGSSWKRRSITRGRVPPPRWPSHDEFGSAMLCRQRNGLQAGNGVVRRAQRQRHHTKPYGRHRHRQHAHPILRRFRPPGRQPDDRRK